MKRDRNVFSLGQPLPTPTPAVLPAFFHLSALTLPEDRPLTKALQPWSVRRTAHSQILLGAQPSPPGSCGLLKGKWKDLVKRERLSLACLPPCFLFLGISLEDQWGSAEHLIPVQPMLHRGSGRYLAAGRKAAALILGCWLHNMRPHGLNARETKLCPNSQSESDLRMNLDPLKGQINAQGLACSCCTCSLGALCDGRKLLAPRVDS